MSASYTEQEWRDEAERRFGSDMDEWKFVCPCCKYEQKIRDYKDAGAPVGHVAFSCVGRSIEGAKEAFSAGKTGPCNYAGGGLFALNPVQVALADGSEVQLFDFAEVADDD